MILEIILLSLGSYLLIGALFALPFVWIGVGRIDSHAASGSFGFRLLIIPGSALLWPLLARRWMRGISHPPEERNAHRCAANIESKVSAANAACHLDRNGTTSGTAGPRQAERKANP